ncbi:MAG TPA: hypothetical protein P5013_01520 [Methanoregula sp.]|nr:hypothetical protein [Methanoregula sp.]
MLHDFFTDTPIKEGDPVIDPEYLDFGNFLEKGKHPAGQKSEGIVPF